MQDEPIYTSPFADRALARMPGMGHVTTNVRPPPPRPPHLATLMANTYRGEQYSGGTSCWRLRWCAFCLLIATVMQASIVGSNVQQHFMGDRRATEQGSNVAELISSSFLCGFLVVASWSLISQLLLWSDAAVVEVPETQRVHNAKC